MKIRTLSKGLMAQLHLAVVMAIDMAGAVYTTAIRVNEPRTAIAPFVLLVVLTLLAYVRRPVMVGRPQAA